MSLTDYRRRPRPESVANLDSVLRRIADGTLTLPRPFLKARDLQAPRPAPATCEHDRTGIIALQQAVAGVFGLRRDDLIARCRAKEVAFPRQIAMYLARELTGASLPQIGHAFDRDHTTVLHACRRVKAVLRRDGPLVNALARLAERFRAVGSAEQAKRIESVAFERAFLRCRTEST